MPNGPLTTTLCERLGIAVPIVQAPVGSATTPELAAAVSNAGALGTLALSWRRPDQVRRVLDETRRLTARPFGVNLVLQWPQHERLAICLEARVPVISTFWGDPQPYAAAIEDAGAIHVHTAGSAREAAAAVAAGVNVIVAQGWEAGGHVRGQVATTALVPAIVDAVAPVPVIAAGGIVDGRGLLAALALGAEAAWMGTRFLLADEASVHDHYRGRIAAAAETDTLYSTVFDGGWPDAPHRTLRNSTTAAWEAAGRPAPPRRPGEGEPVAVAPDGRPLLRYGDDPPLRGTTGDVEALALYAGQGTGIISVRSPAAQIVEEVAAQALETLSRLATPASSGGCR